MKLFIMFLFLLDFTGKEAFAQPFFALNPNLNPAPVFYPQFSNPLSVLPQGTPLVPLCSIYSGPACFNQWMRQSIPLSVQQATRSQLNYFTPSFVPHSRLVLKSTSMKDWKPVKLPSTDERGSRSFYFHKKEPEKARMVERNEKGEIEKIVEGEVFYINSDDIEEAPPQKATEEVKIQTEEVEVQTEEVEVQTEEVEVQTEEVEVQTEDPDLDKAKNPEDVAPEPPLRSQLFPRYVTRRETRALPTAGGIEAEPGCWKINKAEVQTEGAFCFECIRDIPENEYFQTFLQNRSFLDRLKGLLTQAQSHSRSKVNSQIKGALSGDGTDQICSPLVNLQLIIRNFESSCPPYNQRGKGFKKFFEKSLCEGCEKGIPVELMMAMMSIESAGRCTARNRRGENSAGLFQVDSNQHICKEGYRKGTERNSSCLADIHNNWNKSIEILSDFYKNLNGQDLKNPCKNWIDMEPEERDAFRRAVSGYNGGYWILNSIRAAKNNKRGRAGRFALSYKDDKSSWEEIRAFFFIQNIRGTGGRSQKNNNSNLAHTEAILGREVQNSVPGVIEIWSQYKRDFLRDNPTRCLQPAK